MKTIKINEPVWNGGNTYLSVRTDRVKEGVNYIECLYPGEFKPRMFPKIYYLPSSYCKKVYKERWGQAYRAYLNELETVSFCFIIEWEGYGDEPDKEYKTSRNNFDDMLEGIKQYLNRWEGRGAELACCWMETSKKTHAVDLTEHIKPSL